jgi:FtsP/CotA-like multicopper oxidase with cupredoxin domain
MSVFISRRGLLSGSAWGVAFALSSGINSFASAQNTTRAAPNAANENFKPDVEIELICRPDSASVLNGPPTNVWRYAANLIKGPENTLEQTSNSYLGPTIKLTKGQKVRIHLRNALPERTITHWHGLHVPMLMDGHPAYAIDPGETYVYEFETLNRASMNFYHPHTHEATATQVYRGLAGAIRIGDEEERRLELPSGEYEIPIVIQDRSFDEQNQLVYGGGMHAQMLGFYGDRILVNGRAESRFDVSSRAYRLRILNASNARIYKLGWDDGMPVTVIGVDGGLLERPQTRPYVMLAPAERLDVWADFSGRTVGSQLVMRSLPFSGALPKMAECMMGGGACGMGMRGGMMASVLPMGSDYPLFTFHVVKSVGDSPKLPEKLAMIERYRTSDLANPDTPRPIAISEQPMAMTLNGQPYGEGDVLPEERIPLGTVQLIEIFRRNGGAGMMGRMRMGMMGGMGRMGGGMGMMMTMAHPIHLHGEYFQIVGRNVDPAFLDNYSTMRDGFVDDGFKDTILVAPGETVRIAKPFHHFKGRFMFHCHNLEHEDMGMMREFLVE